MLIIFKINVRIIFLVLTTRSYVAMFRQTAATIEKVTVRLPTKKCIYYPTPLIILNFHISRNS